MNATLQPLLHDEIVILRAPTQAWSSPSGAIGSGAIHGIYHSDVRIVSRVEVRYDGYEVESIATVPGGAESVAFIGLLRHLDDSTPDPRVRVVQRRTVTTTGAIESIVFESTLEHEVSCTVVVRLQSDLAEMDLVKAGLTEPLAAISIEGETASWGRDAIEASLRATGAALAIAADGFLELTWTVTIPAKGSTRLGWAIEASDADAVVRGLTTPPGWSVPVLTGGDDRLARWVSRALGDLDALRLTTVADPTSEFLAAGAPWFFTLFGRDSIWAARFMLPLGTRLAGDTLRVLAGLQGTATVAETAEQPGKIMHELRRGTLEIPGAGISLPPLYYGTVDATALWVCLLHDAWRWGLPGDEVRSMIPQLVAALEWMRDFGDADGDGLLEYVDSTGKGLANQGWKDSGDSVQWRNGSLAEGPIALCEVQAYAFEAATHGADLLDHFGVDGGDEWRAWAALLKSRFNETFWIQDSDGAYPAIALDAQKRAVDTVTSNLGHLLGTGLLDDRQAALVTRRLVSPELNSGFGLRTMSTDSAGYWPLSYHGGSVWTHDTAIAIHGLSRDGFVAEAGTLVSGLLAAASGFDYRMPELHSGDAASAFASPVPYPAACRPQAWSAAAAVSVLGSVLGLNPDAQSATIGVSPSPLAGSLSVSGLRLGDADVSITLNHDGEVTAASGAGVLVG
ncbi:glycogen debranching N-terminal domain-containing protein [Lacisediminihabitans profunda]|uniref:Amylo-alpha-1,6-glucosidase n=1 Tax=Lacisediminihabitans profunda TaxID=2594790 RepID=A0A5C8UPT8_9MICO|nr:glycogen debranching N-terminal domain-containing protein [Lacisediminihabitans profunda]TXN30468.1 amylo-alpha-1,6-glucosidase [Lacisediminihabitans profunda]